MSASKERLQKKYGKGKTLRELMADVVQASTQNIAEKITERQINEFEKSWERQPKGRRKGKRLVLPGVTEILPDAEQLRAYSKGIGDEITDTMRDRVVGSMRKTIQQFALEGKQRVVRPAGRTAGQINPELFDQLKKDLVSSTKQYTRKNPKSGVPDKVDEIAASTLRSTIINSKREYVLNLVALNPKAKAWKTWNHNPSLSKEPRKAHGQMNGKKKPFFGIYMVNHYQGNKKIGVDPMEGPHDPDAPLHQKISCHCDITYTIRIYD